METEEKMGVTSKKRMVPDSSQMKLKMHSFGTSISISMSSKEEIFSLCLYIITI